MFTFGKRGKLTMNMQKTVSVTVTALTLTGLLGATCFASPTREQIEAEDNAYRARGITVAYYDDDDYAHDRVPADIAERVVEPDDGFSSGDMD